MAPHCLHIAVFLLTLLPVVPGLPIPRVEYTSDQTHKGSVDRGLYYRGPYRPFNIWGTSNDATATEVATSSTIDGTCTSSFDEDYIPSGRLTTSATPYSIETSSASSMPAQTDTMTYQDIFAKAVDTRHPPSMMRVMQDHPVPRKGITQSYPLQTNKFYSNFFLTDQRAPTYTFPYSLVWGGGNGVSGSWGMVCSHIEADQRVFGEEKHSSASSYYINPVGIESLALSAKELMNDTAVSMDNMTAFSARVHLSARNGHPPAISFPLVQGMPFVTAEYHGVTPILQSGVFFRTVTKTTRDLKPNLSKYTVVLENGATWRVYAWSTTGGELDLDVVSNGLAIARRPFTGVVQIAKDPMTRGSEQLLDDGAGVYPTSVTLSGSVADRKGWYHFDFHRAGHNMGSLYMYALPHHMQSFDRGTAQGVQRMGLQTPTKGVATLVKGSRWTMVEPEMPNDMEFAPWNPTNGSVKSLSGQAKSLIRAAAEKEMLQDITGQCNLDSMYFSGKALAKFAQLMYVVQDMLGDESLASKGLGRLKEAFGIFASNKQKFPLRYECAWGGVVSSASYETGDLLVDFGNTQYNDHHFHYGYHILAAAIIGYLDPSWLAGNKEYINTLVRDVANPSADDKYFPMWRNFDWYHGHSWAHGLFASMDGKNQESSSEDMMHVYALKMWGQVVGDKELEARSNLQLAILGRSLGLYYLYMRNNTVQPGQFIGNKVAGILFENKADHTTFFSPDIEAIQGIHMIPILPPTPFIRTPAFTREEWETFFSGGRIDRIRNGWASIIYGSYATVDPARAWAFFTSRSFDPQWLDGGVSLAWLQAYSAALGGI